MNLPFLLKSVANSRTTKDVEIIFTKLLRALPNLEGSIVSNSLNILSKKEVTQPIFYWKKTAELLTEPTVNTKDKTAAVIHKYNVNDVCIILNSFAKIDCIHHGLLDTSTKIIIDHIREAHIRSICNVIHSLGKFGQISLIKDIVKKLISCNKLSARVSPNKTKKVGNQNSTEVIPWESESIQKLVEKFSEKDFSMLLRVLILNHNELGTEDTVKDLLASLTSKCENLTDQTIAILVNSVASYGRDDNGLLYVLSPIIVFRLKKLEFTPQCIAQISNGYARLDIKDTVLFDAISTRVCKDIDRFSVRAIVNVLNAHAKLSIYSEELFTLCIGKLEGRVKEMTPQCIGNTISAYSKFYKSMDKCKLQGFFKVLCKCTEDIDSFSSFIPQNYVNILDGFTRLDIFSQKLFLKFAENLVKQKSRLNHIDIKSLLFSIYHCKIVHSKLLLTLLSQLKFVMRKMKQSFMTNSIFIISQLHSVCSPDGKYFKTGEFLYLPLGESKDAILTNHPQHNELTYIQSKLLESMGFLILHMKNLGLASDFSPSEISTCIKSLLRCNILDYRFIDLLLQQLSKYLKRENISGVLSILGILPMINHKIPDHLLEGIRKMYLTPNESIDLLHILCQLNQTELSIFNIIKTLNLWKCDVVKTHLTLSLFINHMYTSQCSLETFTQTTKLSRKLINLCKCRPSVSLCNLDIVKSALILHLNGELGCMSTSMLESVRGITNNILKPPSKNSKYELREEAESIISTLKESNLANTVEYFEFRLLSYGGSLTMLIK